MSTDMWEHIDEDDQVAAEAARVLRPGGRLLVAVPAGMDLWSGHDVALGHVRRYDRDGLVALVRVGRPRGRAASTRGTSCCVRSPSCGARASDASESEMEEVHPRASTPGLRAAVALESVLPVTQRRGISLVLRARKPSAPRG